MSAYIVDRKHVVYLVQSAISRRLNRDRGPFTWYHGDQRGELRDGEYEFAAEVANMLWSENVKSVSHRYPNETTDTLPGPMHETFEVTQNDFRIFAPEPDPVQVLKACDCFEYQSCEHDEWEQSGAKAFLDALRKAAWHALPGYDDAAWGAPEPRCVAALAFR